MFERLLAALIILALLVLVMFIALPPGDLQWGKATPPSKPDAPTPEVAVNPEPAKPEPARPEVLKPVPAKSELVPAQTPQPKPVPDEVVVAGNEPPPIPPLPDKSPLRTAPVPNPTGNAAETAKGTPTPKELQDRAVASSDGPARRKFVKYYLDRLPLSPDAEPPPRSSTAGRYDLLPPPPVESRPRLNGAKSDKLYFQRPPQRFAQRPAPRFAARETRERSDDIGNYIRRTDDDAPNGWYRARYNDCTDGQCDCGCPQPYWASSAGCRD